MIDLHLHTTASDGLLPPDALVERAASAGFTIISVTDHDTVAGLAPAAAAAAPLGVTLVAGIEITAVEDERDVHVLGYFFDPAHPGLSAFLRGQRADRARRVREMGARLGALGYGIDVEGLVAAAGGARSVGRPALADALVASGRVGSREEAFARLLGQGCPAFVPRRGADAATVIRLVHEAGGIASLAHPGVLDRDDLVERLAPSGLDALEVWHSDHSPRQRARYLEMSARLGLARSGGSDYHGDGVHGGCVLGGVVLPFEEFSRLEQAATARR